MPSAPVIYIDPTTGVVSWTNPATLPVSWNLQLNGYDGNYNSIAIEQEILAGSASSFDAFGNGWAGGGRVSLWGTDANSNTIYAPSLSAGLTKNQ
jgi:hypothetical protein